MPRRRSSPRHPNRRRPAPVVDHTVEAPVGGAPTGVAEECLPELESLRNVHLLAV